MNRVVVINVINVRIDEVGTMLTCPRDSSIGSKGIPLLFIQSAIFLGSA